MVILLMGVSGAGKTTIGLELVARLATRGPWVFLDADDDHSPENVAKMRAGIPLTDADRDPWLTAVGERLARHQQRGENVVLACSALKEAYRERLRAYADEWVVIFLTAPARVLAQRLADRKGHFMHENMLQSQIDTLEPPTGALTIDVSGTPQSAVDEILRRLPTTGASE